MSSDGVKTGAQLLEEWKCLTREQKLELACLALTSSINELHIAYEKQDLSQPNSYFCSCADAYNMGIEALRKPS